jgi:hypothetical protein
MVNRIEDALIVIAFITTFVVKFILSHNYQNFAEIFFFIAIAFALLYFYLVYKKSYSNIGILAFTTFLILGVFPFSHFLIYNHNHDSYTVSQEYIYLRKNEIQLELNHYKDCDNLNIILNELPLDFLENSVDDSLIFQKIVYNDYYLEILPNKNLRRPTQRHVKDKVIVFYNIANPEKLASINLASESLIFGINEKIREREELTELLKNPKDDVHFGALWLDSITGFIFGNFKPLARLPQIIQILQIISWFFFVYMITTYLDNSSKFKIQKIKEEN